MFTSNRIGGALAIGLCMGLAVMAQQNTTDRKIPVVAAIVKLADDVDGKDVPARAKKLVEEHDACDMPIVFTLKKRGGAGIGSAVAAGHKDSIEDLVRNWSGKKPPTKEELETHQKDLVRMARVLQVMSELAPHRVYIYVPKNNEKRAGEWLKVSADFKEVTRALRDAIEKTEPDQTRKAAIKLQETCTACHKVAGV